MENPTKDDGVARNIKRLREARGLSNKELAALVRCTPGNMSRLENGKQGYNQETLHRVAAALNVTVPDLFARERDIEGVIQLGLRVPIISWIAAGHTALPPAAEVQDWITCPVKHSPNTYALKVQGESMHNPSGSPSFSDGDIIFVDPTRDYIHRSIVIVRSDDEKSATFKRLLIDGGSSRMLETLNPAWPNRIFPVTTKINLCGVVIARLESFI